MRIQIVSFLFCSAYSKQVISEEEVNGDSHRQADDEDDVCNPVADDDEKDIIELRFVPVDVESRNHASFSITFIRCYAF